MAATPSSDNNQVHVVVLPWLAFGHMIPFLELSIALAKSGIHVSFLSTPKNIQRLPQIPPNLSKSVDLVPFPLPRIAADHLPETAEATVDVAAEQIQHLKKSYDLLREPIRDFVARARPNWIVVDFNAHWAAGIAGEFGIPLIRYYAVSAAAAVFFGSPENLVGDLRRTSPESWTAPPEWVDFPTGVSYRRHEAGGVHAAFYGADAGDGGELQCVRLAEILRASEAIAIRSCDEFEGDYLRVHAKITGKPVFPVGLLPPEKFEEEKVTLAGEPWVTIFNWLDKQRPKSVVFVCFGSETKLNKENIHEIAHGIELSGLPFLWAVRKPAGVSDDDETAALLPPGFTTRTAAQGVVHIGWAPQREILGHPSIGGLFFHAGWGSIIEAMQFGQVLVFMPFIIDQPLNARMMVEKGLGIEVERDEDGSFTRNDIANALRKAMVSKEGEGLKARTEQAVVEIFRNYKLNENYVEKFVKYLKNKTR